MTTTSTSDIVSVSTMTMSRKRVVFASLWCVLFLSGSELGGVLATSSSSGPTSSPPGLSVSGGSSRLKHYARRIKAYREVRVSPPPPPPLPPVASEAKDETMTNVVREGEDQVYYETSLNVDVSQPLQQRVEDPNVVVTTMTSPLPPPPQQVEAVAPVVASTTSSSSNSKMAIVYMGLLALQFGIQPMLVRKFTPQGICKSSVVLTQEVFKFGLAATAYLSTTRPECRVLDRAHLTLKTWLTMAGLPACLYTIQNLASLMAYQNLEALTFNILNQTKILSAALCCYLIMGKKQSKLQSLSLVLLLVSALVIEKVISVSSLMSGSLVHSIQNAWGMLGSGSGGALSKRFTHGVVPVLVASFLSGFNGALTQRNLQGSAVQKRRPKNSYLFSMELCAASSLVLALSLLVSGDGRTIASKGFFHNWQSPKVLIPIVTNSLGGILVGLVTKHAGSVRKGFALIFGIFVSGLLQSEGVSSTQWLGGILAAVSLWMHATNPHSEPKK